MRAWGTDKTASDGTGLSGNMLSPRLHHCHVRSVEAFWGRSINQRELQAAMWSVRKILHCFPSCILVG